MSYDSLEASAQSGQPVDLYEITIRAPFAPEIALSSDEFPYADIPSLNASGWAVVYNSIAETGLTGSIFEGTDGRGMTLTVASGSVTILKPDTELGAHGLEVSKTFSDLDPAATYRVRALGMRAIANQISNGLVASGLGSQQQSSVSAGSGAFDVSVSLQPDVAGRIAVRFGFFFQAADPESDNRLVLNEINLYSDGIITAANALRYTSADVEVAYDGNLYTPALFERSDRDYASQEDSGADLTLDCPRDHVLAGLVGYGAADPEVTLIWRRVQYGDLTESRIPFRGTLAAAEFQGARCRLTFRPLLGRLAVPVPRFAAGRTCPFRTYDSSTCGVFRADFSHSIEVTAVDGATLTVPGIAAIAGDDTTYFLRGVCAPESGPARTIQSSDLTAETIVLTTAIPGLAAGDTVVLTAGDDHTVGTCQARFNNVARFGGSAKMPVRDPFSGAGVA